MFDFKQLIQEMVVIFTAIGIIIGIVLVGLMWAAWWLFSHLTIGWA